MRKLKLDELGRHSIEQYKSVEKHPIVVVLDNIRSAMNVGSFFRTCDCFAVEKIVLTGISATPPHKEIFKTAIGAQHSVEWSYEENIADAIKSLKDQQYAIIGIEQTDDSISLKEYKYQEADKIALVFGNEVDGITSEVLPQIDQCIEIDQYGTKHSLNVAVCAGIVLWEIVRKMEKSGD